MQYITEYLRMDDAIFQFIVSKVSRFIAKHRFISICCMLTVGTTPCWYVNTTILLIFRF